jgi:hypothetical protein
MLLTHQRSWDNKDGRLNFSDLSERVRERQHGSLMALILFDLICCSFIDKPQKYNSGLHRHGECPSGSPATARSDVKSDTECTRVSNIELL